MSSHNKYTSTTEYFGTGSEGFLDPVIEARKAIDTSNDKLSGLQDTLADSRAKIDAILKGENVSPNYVAESAKEPVEKKDNFQVERLKKEKAELDAQLADKNRQIADKNDDLEKVRSELSKCNSQCALKTNDLNAIQAHAKDVETLILTVAASANITPASVVKADDSDLNVEKSKRFDQMIALLKQFQGALKSKSEEVDKAVKAKNDAVADLKLAQGQVVAGDSALAGELAKLRADLENSNEAKNKLQAEYVKDLEASRKELLGAVNELNAANNQLVETNGQLAAVENSLGDEIQQLKDQLAESDAARASLKNDNAALDKKATQLYTLYQNSLNDKKSGGQEAAAANKALEEQLKALEDANGQIAALQAQLAQLGAAHKGCDDKLKAQVAAGAKEVSALQGQLAEHQKQLEDHRKQSKDQEGKLAQRDGDSAAKIAELTNQLRAAQEEASANGAARNNDTKNSEKLIASLESSLEGQKKELAALSSQNAALEAKIGELHRQILEKKSFVKGMENEELENLRKELHAKSLEVEDLRERNKDLAVNNADYLEERVQTENDLNAEIVKLQEHIAALNADHEAATDDLHRQVDQLHRQYYGTTARDAEKKIAFTKEAFRAHLKANGIKVFHWEDMPALIKKIEDLHNKPHAPIVTVSELIETNGESPQPSPTAASHHAAPPLPSVPSSANVKTPPLQPKKSTAVLKVAPSKRTLVKSPGHPAALDVSDTASVTSGTSQQRTPPAAKGSFRVDPNGSTAGREMDKKTGLWVPVKVDKTDPFGDLRKKNAAAGSHRQLVDKFEMLKQSNSFVKRPETRTVKAARAAAGAGNAIAMEEEEEVQPYNDEVETY